MKKETIRLSVNGQVHELAVEPKQFLLDGLRTESDGTLVAGALTRICTLVNSAFVARQFSVLHQAARTVASPLLRNLGTLGGNLCLDTRCLYYNQSAFWREALGYCLKKDGTVCHVAPGGRVCWAVFSGDTAPALLTLDACLELASPRGTREVPLAEALQPADLKVSATSSRLVGERGRG